jgi:hypothetical protein
MWMSLEDIMLSETSQDRKTGTHAFTHMWQIRKLQLLKQKGQRGLEAGYQELAKGDVSTKFQLGLDATAGRGDSVSHNALHLSKLLKGKILNVLTTET